MRRSVLAAVFLAMSGLGVAGMAAGAGRMGSDPEKLEMKDVKIDNFTFGPAEVTVTAGTTITWTNRDDIPHTVLSTDKAFKSTVLDTDQKYSFTFSKPGTFSYFCSIHPTMTGKVVVR
jgi:amicyanin